MMKRFSIQINTTIENVAERLFERLTMDTAALAQVSPTKHIFKVTLYFSCDFVFLM